eukprot:1915427-Pleurochrysis_carterae.AAC.4
MRNVRLHTMCRCKEQSKSGPSVWPAHADAVGDASNLTGCEKRYESLSRQTATSALIWTWLYDPLRRMQLRRTGVNLPKGKKAEKSSFTVDNTLD